MRKIDTVGRVVLSKELRDIYGLDFGDQIEIVDNGNGILVKPIKKLFYVNENQVDILRQIYFMLQGSTVLNDVQTATLKDICKITDTKCPMCGEELCVGSNGSYICFNCASNSVEEEEE